MKKSERVVGMTEVATEGAVMKGYEAFEQTVSERVARATEAPLFETDAQGLFEEYLEALPPELRQYFRCHACRRFINRRGGLVKLDDDGWQQPVLWLPVEDPVFNQVAAALYRRVITARVTGVLVNGEETWGTSRTGEWTHLHGRPSNVFVNQTKTAEQAAAALREDHHMLSRALAEYTRDAVYQAVRVLESNSLDRSEMVLEQARWLLALHDRLVGERGHRRSNVIWLAVAKAPAGWSHVKSGVISTLLDDVVAGREFEQIRRHWSEKLHPLKYRRPTSISEGNVKEANETVEKLKSAGSLRRRFARLGDVLRFIWQPREEERRQESPQGGPFDHLLPRHGQVKEVELPPRELSWERFCNEVLSTASRVELLTPCHDQFYALVTAEQPEAPPILAWDGLEGHPRNPTSWYFYHGGSPTLHWKLVPGTWVQVTGIFRKPCYWQEPEKFTRCGGGVFLALAGALDTKHVFGGGFFPEHLRSEYHPVRHAMEAYARSVTVSGIEEGDANGICLEKHSLTLRVDKQQYVVSY